MEGPKKFSLICILVLVQNGNIVTIHVVVFLSNMYMLVDEWRLMMLCDVFSVFFNFKFNLLWSFPYVAHTTIIIAWYFVDYITSFFNFKIVYVGLLKTDLRVWEGLWAIIMPCGLLKSVGRIMGYICHAVYLRVWEGLWAIIMPCGLLKSVGRFMSHNYAMRFT